MDLNSAHEAISVKSEQLNIKTPIVCGYDFGRKGELIDLNYEELFKSYLTTGFQATNLAYAIEVLKKIFNVYFILQEINKMLEEREKSILEILSADQLDPFFKYPSNRKRRALTIFLGYTSNMVTSGLREVLFIIFKN